MSELLALSHEYVQGVAMVNRGLGIPHESFVSSDKLPDEIDPTRIWNIVGLAEKDPYAASFDVEIFWGIDAVGGVLVCTERTTGDRLSVVPKSHHLIGVHSHPLEHHGLFSDDRPYVAPNEIASMLETQQYAELVFTRQRNRMYPCLLAIQTLVSKDNRYGAYEDTQQTFHLISLINNEFPWQRARKFREHTDQFANEKGIALYRGTIDPKSNLQQPLTMVRTYVKRQINK